MSWLAAAGGILVAGHTPAPVPGYRETQLAPRHAGQLQVCWARRAWASGLLREGAKGTREQQKGQRGARTHLGVTCSPLLLKRMVVQEEPSVFLVQQLVVLVAQAMHSGAVFSEAAEKQQSSGQGRKFSRQ